MQPQDKTDIRPTLIAVGLLLAPDDFQIVLDADSTSISKYFSSSISVFTKTQEHFLRCFLISKTYVPTRIWNTHIFHIY